MALAALLFDLDGTLVDSDPFHFSAFQAVLSRHGKPPIDEEFFARRMSGHSNGEICQLLWPELPAPEQRRMAEEKEELFRAMVAEIQPIIGLDGLLDWTERQGLRLGLVSNAPMANLEAIVDALKIRARFTVLVSGNELPRGKPDPLPYQTALDRLGVTAAAAVAFEDAVPGLTSAVRAAIPTVGMATTQPVSVLMESGASLVIDDFADPRLMPFLNARF